MAKFVAATAVEALDYDFTSFIPGCEGTVPEPTTAQIDQYFNSIRELVKEVQALKSKADAVQDRDASEVTNEEIDEVLATMDDLSLSHYQKKMVAIAADLCSQQPSEDQINALPFRVAQAFVQWITGEFRPEAEAATTRR